MRAGQVALDEARACAWAELRGMMASVRQYVRGDVHTNTVEGFFALLKRGIIGTFHSVSRKHLHRYLAEFEFRYNARKMEDGERTALAIRSSEGKRLMRVKPHA